ncbi:MAG: pilus assembly protein PilM [Nitrospinota bacterium]
MNGLLKMANIPVEESCTGAVATDDHVIVVDLVPRNTEYVLRAFGKVVFDKPITNLTSLAAKAISSICRKNKLRAKTVCCLAPAADMFIRRHRMPPMGRLEIINSARFSGRETSPFPIDTASIDAWVEHGEKTTGNNNVLIAVLDGSGTNRIKKLFGRTPLRLTAISIVPVALAAIVKKSRTIDRSLPVPILNIDESTTGIYLFVDGQVNFIREINIGGNEITRLMAAGFEISKKKAGDIAAKFGIPMGNELHENVMTGKTGEMALEKIRPCLDRLVNEINRSFEHFKNRQRVNRIPTVLITGSAASLKNLAAYLGSVTEYDFRLYNPFDDFLVVENESIKPGIEKGPEIVVPVGLAIDRGRTINLLPERYRYSFDKFKGRAAALAITAAYLIFLAGLKFTGIHYLENAQSRLNGAKLISSGLKKEQEATVLLVNEIFNVKSEIKNIEKRIRFYPETKGNNVKWPAVFLEIARSLPDDAALDKIKLSFGHPPEYAANGNLYDNHLLIYGKIRGDEDKKLKSLRSYLEKMQSSTMFEHASLISTKQGGPAGTGSSILLFTLSAAIRYPQ